ncbi:hypothetical protein TNCV_3503781 [Trichonephila clavipes]|uniref:Uncharacterized protein n=1 Tax=Trichonephila clavipes TaxID=2585209 RepID=A0A8X6V2S3_TRICX|nr:hypothetical protein TNCV_3503781 [Trichonephila clavipes]
MILDRFNVYEPLCTVDLPRREGVNIKFALVSYTRALGDGPRNFEPHSSDDISAVTTSLNYPTTPTEGRYNPNRSSYTRAFEPWSRGEDDTLAGTPSPNYHITSMGGRLRSRQI